MAFNSKCCWHFGLLNSFWKIYCCTCCLLPALNAVSSVWLCNCMLIMMFGWHKMYVPSCSGAGCFPVCACVCVRRMTTSVHTSKETSCFATLALSYFLFFFYQVYWFIYLFLKMYLCGWPLLCVMMRDNVYVPYMNCVHVAELCCSQYKLFWTPGGGL